jgi:hypothetical protein
LPPIEEIDRSKQTVEKSKVNLDSADGDNWDEGDGFL